MQQHERTKKIIILSEVRQRKTRIIWCHLSKLGSQLRVWRGWPWRESVEWRTNFLTVGCPFIVILGHSYDFRHILYMTVTEVKSTFGYNDKSHFMQFKNKRKLLDPLYGRQGGGVGFKKCWVRNLKCWPHLCWSGCFLFSLSSICLQMSPPYFPKQKCFLLTAQHMAKDTFLVSQNFQEWGVSLFFS